MSTAENHTQPQTPSEQNHPEFIIQRIYLKDASFECPSSPQVFSENLQPTIHLNINTATQKLADDTHEVTLHVTVTASVENRTVFLIEVKKSGLFTIKNIPEQNMGMVLGVTCPTILFPYLRETISTLASQGGFTHFYLAPINFEALYHANQQKQAEQTDTIN